MRLDAAIHTSLSDGASLLVGLEQVCYSPTQQLKAGVRELNEHSHHATNAWTINSNLVVLSSDECEPRRPQVLRGKVSRVRS